MPDRRTTVSAFITEGQRRSVKPEPELTSLLDDVQTACKLIASAMSHGRTGAAGIETRTNAGGERQKPFDVITHDIMVETCGGGGQLRGMVSEEADEPIPIPAAHPRGRYLLCFDPLDGSSNIDVDAPVGTIFSVLRCTDGVDEPAAADFLQPGSAQVAAGYAIYGAVAMLVLTIGAGVHGFTLDRDIGAFVLTHPDMAIPVGTREFAVNASRQRFWEPPVRRYVEECVMGADGPREVDFNMRWLGAMVADVHRILLRGGLYMYPCDGLDRDKPGRLRLLYEASPMAMIVEQAGGGASTGRERILDVVAETIHQRVPVILGAHDEVERLVRYHADHDAGREPAFRTPLFGARSLFIGA